MRVIKAAKAVGVQQVKAGGGFYGLPTDAAAIVSEINKLAAKGKGQSGGVPSVYRSMPSGRLQRFTTSFSKTTSPRRVPPNSSRKLLIASRSFLPL